MSYQEQITPWIVVRLLPDMQRITVARFKTRSNADGYAQALRQLIEAEVVVMFDLARAEGGENRTG